MREKLTIEEKIDSILKNSQDTVKMLYMKNLAEQRKREDRREFRRNIFQIIVYLFAATGLVAIVLSLVEIFGGK